MAPGPLGDGVPSTQNPRRPYIVALEHRRDGQRNESVHERELVMQLWMWVRLSRTNAIASSGLPRHTARTARIHKPKHRKTTEHRLQARTSASSMRRSASAASPVASAIAPSRVSTFPAPDDIFSARNPSRAAGEPVAGGVDLPRGAFDLARRCREVGIRDDVHGAGAPSEP